MHELHVHDVLGRKAAGHELTAKEIELFVERVSREEIDRLQLGALLMAIYTRGMVQREVTQLTAAMTRSGEVLRWPDDWTVVDKHSTGGVGDKVSLPLAPALAALGFKVPMVSGRGLGHTGGTLDKLEAIPGFSVSQTAGQMRACLERVGCCIVGQTQTLVPADRVLYASRDVTHTVDSAPLICSSIVSKKAAEGLQALVLDVKYGAGAFQRDARHAAEIARMLVDTANGMGISTAALITSMESPIGQTVGNALEVAEAVRCLRGRGAADLRELVTALGGQLVQLAGRGSAQHGAQLVARALADGSALDKFRQMLVCQGVSEPDAHQLCHGDEWTVLPRAPAIEDVCATDAGFVHAVDAMAVARVCAALGAGRKQAGDSVDHRVGITFLVRLGDMLEIGQPWAQIHHCGNLTDAGRLQVRQALRLTAQRPSPAPRVTGLVQRQ
ncbi:thymidine phosphorylase-like [Amphibalanus amphitrite]|uniref:thymidine phosphorylase-like n=1 Tax=Amphibalanus amphitrite TaxID=1232801 RepID=UPI001C911CF7|nr:thymidine phosphorylase-like [Amphibalanus amphitrite]